MNALTKTLVLILLLLCLAACGEKAISPTAISSPAPSQPTTLPTATLDRLREGLTAVAATRTAAPTPDELTPTATPIISMSLAAETYLNEALTIIRENALNRNQIDWDRMESVARAGANGAVTTQDTYPVIRFVLRELNDHHSQFLTPEEVARWSSAGIVLPVSETIMEDIGYIHIYGFKSDHPVTAEQYATTIQSRLAQLVTQNPCGWIVDLRGNTGGNMWPMLAGLGPLLGEGLQGYFKESDGEMVPWYYQNGQALIADGQPLVSVAQPLILEQTGQPVAVLIDDQTASAGEAIVVAFRGRDQTRFFGMPTAGLSTGNFGYELADGAIIMLTESVFTDRTGVTYGGELLPDELTEAGTATIDAAAAWLMTQPSCKGEQ